MATYKVSYVVTGSDFPGTIANSDHRPEVGERVKLGEEEFVIIEVIDLMPARGEFHFIHATCKPVEDA
jgi:hypothetical protein